MAESFDDLKFDPTVQEIVERQAGKPITVFTGTNNSGKSAYLKNFVSYEKCSYVGVNRFYSFHHMQFYDYNENELAQFYNNMYNQRRKKHSNFEGTFYNMNKAFSRLNNNQRGTLFTVFEEIFGSKMSIELEIPDNAMSQRYISVDGESLSVTSSGTRLFIGVLATLMDERFDLIAIDEPELGLAPPLQSRLAKLMTDSRFRERLFPHNPMFMISTHSHLFLDKGEVENNFTVTREGDRITAKRCRNLNEFYEIQLRMLGNELRDLFLPDAVVFVEGKTDKKFLETVCKLALGDPRVVIEQCGGDIAQRLTFWAQTLGDFQISPYRNRTFYVIDAVAQEGLGRATASVGLPKNACIEWSRNGIEFVYPLRILRAVFRNEGLGYDDLAIQRDRVVHGELSYTKMELCEKVCAELTEEDCLQGELQSEFVSKLARSLSA